MPEMTTILHRSVQDGLDRYGLKYQIFECDPDYADTALFCERYGFSQGQSANAIIAGCKVEPVKFACCVVLATTKLDVNKKLRQLLDVKKTSFATAEQTLELTGMLIGGVTPFGLPNIPIYVDSAVMNNEQIILGGGNRSTKILMHPDELTKLPNAQIVENLAIPK
ncbi:MAG TPA: YbaK/EbsC family protein [Chroococcales cyanobacterium]